MQIYREFHYDETMKNYFRCHSARIFYNLAIWTHHTRLYIRKVETKKPNPKVVSYEIKYIYIYNSLKPYSSHKSFRLAILISIIFGIFEKRIQTYFIPVVLQWHNLWKKQSFNRKVMIFRRIWLEYGQATTIQNLAKFAMLLIIYKGRKWQHWFSKGACLYISNSHP